MARNFFHEPESGSGKHHSSGIDVTDWDGNLLSAWVEVGEPTIWRYKNSLGITQKSPLLEYLAWDGRKWAAYIEPDNMTLRHYPSGRGSHHTDRYIGYLNNGRKWRASFSSNP